MALYETPKPAMCAEPPVAVQKTPMECLENLYTNYPDIYTLPSIAKIKTNRLEDQWASAVGRRNNTFRMYRLIISGTLPNGDHINHYSQLFCDAYEAEDAGIVDWLGFCNPYWKRDIPEGWFVK
jgi:hypothetical protein